MERGRVTELPSADLRDVGRLGRHRGVAFDAQGTRMAYLRGGARPEVVVRALATGTERVLGVPEATAVRVWFGDRAQSLIVDVADELPPAIRTTIAPRRCRGRPTSYSVFGSNRRRTRRLIYPLDGGAPIRAKRVLHSFGDGHLQYQEDGGIASVDASGREKLLVSGVCDSHLLHVDAEREELLVGCMQEGSTLSFDVWLVTNLGVAYLFESSAEYAETLHSDGRVVRVGDHFVDMVRRVEVPRPKLKRGETRRARYRWGKFSRYAERWDGDVLVDAPKGDSRMFRWVSEGRYERDMERQRSVPRNEGE